MLVQSWISLCLWWRNTNSRYARCQPHPAARGGRSRVVALGSSGDRSFLSVIGEVSSTRRGDPKSRIRSVLREWGDRARRSASGKLCESGARHHDQSLQQWCGRRAQSERHASQRETWQVLEFFAHSMGWPRPKQQFVVRDCGRPTADGLNGMPGCVSVGAC